MIVYDIFDDDAPCREREEMPAERAKRLAADRRRTLAQFKRRGRCVFRTALSEAARRYKSGQPLPINFDIVWEINEYSETERFRISDAHVLRQCGSEDDAEMTHLNTVMIGWHTTRRRGKAIPPHFRLVTTTTATRVDALDVLDEAVIAAQENCGVEGEGF